MPKLLITRGPERGRVLRIASDAPPTLGRQDVDIIIDDSYISKQHARFFMKDDRWYIEDLGSANGTYVNGQRIAEPVKLHRGDRVQIGQTKMVVSPKTRSKQGKGSDRGYRPELDVENASTPAPSDEQKTETDSLDASSLLMDVLGDMSDDEIAKLDEDDDDDIGDYVPDYDPTDPNTHRNPKKNKPSAVDKTTVTQPEDTPKKKAKDEGKKAD